MYERIVHIHELFIANFVNIKLFIEHWIFLSYYYYYFLNAHPRAYFILYFVRREFIGELDQICCYKLENLERIMNLFLYIIIRRQCKMFCFFFCFPF